MSSFNNCIKFDLDTRGAS
ncbi:Protein of unknown function [Lactobacillus helveticus CIRM-BIA 104]|uniref:Uncharacterized protein n=1 Tax=Lactobacillus helveticus CIRM-BIA 104 TaxID=1226333 RepID=U6F9Q2_LACHE|nr:Protein of unknown function [Lactobacillus helveticus CIRM-BIA 104]